MSPYCRAVWTRLCQVCPEHSAMLLPARWQRFASTVTIERASETISDGSAATIITMDVPPAGGPVASLPAPPGLRHESAPTVAESPNFASSATLPQTAKAATQAASTEVASSKVAAPVATPARRGSMGLVIGGVLLVVLIVG